MGSLSPARIASGLRRRLLRWTGIEPHRIDRRRFVAEAAPMQLPRSSPLKRTPPRAPEHRQPGYTDAYDDHSLFYDVFWRDGELVFVGPPLANLAAETLGALRFDGQPTGRLARRLQFNRVDITTFDCPHRPRRVDLDIGGSRLAAHVSEDESAVFAGTKALITLSRNNDLRWIEDWVDFYVRAHGVDAVLLYDNGSTAYSPRDLLRRIAAVPGIRAAVVVAWPFAFGPGEDPTGTMWDSDYCQYAMLEHARRRFVRDAAAIFQVDIDELIVTPGGGSVADLLGQSPAGALHFPGRWMRYVDVTGTPAPRLHRSHRHFVDDGNAAAPKWIAIPSRVPDDVQMGIHDFLGGDFAPTRIDHPMLRHFRAISTNWKYDRSRPEPFDPDRHLPDAEWIAEMRRIGWTA
ncbi:MAG TPA: hypothetical protein PK286_08880 [Devosia sp.]|nr:hypothetical protein [Devosia sp.]